MQKGTGPKEKCGHPIFNGFCSRFVYLGDFAVLFPNKISCSVVLLGCKKVFLWIFDDVKGGWVAILHIIPFNSGIFPGFNRGPEQYWSKPELNHHRDNVLIEFLTLYVSTFPSATETKYSASCL